MKKHDPYTVPMWIALFILAVMILIAATLKSRDNLTEEPAADPLDIPEQHVEI